MMFRITARELFADLRIEALPEPGEIGGRLDRPLVRREQTDYQGHRSARDRGGLAHAEKVLQAGGDPGRLARRSGPAGGGLPAAGCDPGRSRPADGGREES